MKKLKLMSDIKNFLVIYREKLTLISNCFRITNMLQLTRLEFERLRMS